MVINIYASKTLFNVNSTYTRTKPEGKPGTLSYRLQVVLDNPRPHASKSESKASAKQT